MRRARLELKGKYTIIFVRVDRVPKKDNYDGIYEMDGWDMKWDEIFVVSDKTCSPDHEWKAARDLVLCEIEDDGVEAHGRLLLFPDSRYTLEYLDGEPG